MKLTTADFWRPSGTTDRRSYALVGFVGFALKHNLDRLVATLVFHRPWGFFNYWVPLQDVRQITDLHSADTRFLEGMLALALPFIWGGVIFTLRRLRSAQLPTWLLFLFFIPYLNLLFFLVLCLAPEKGVSNTRQSEPDSWFWRFVPQSAIGSAAASLLITVPFGYGVFWVGIDVLKVYGWGVFVAIPFTMGFGAALIYGLRKPRSLGAQMGVAVLAVALLGLLLLGVAMEGAVCLMMAIPIAAPLAIFGGACAYFVQRQRWPRGTAPVLAGMLLVFTPGVQTVEHMMARPAETFVVQSSIDIQASPEEVWRQVVAFRRSRRRKNGYFAQGLLIRSEPR